MKKQFVLIVTMVSIALYGCSSPSSTAPDNSKELESLKAQVEALQTENEALKKSLEATASIVESEESDSQDTPSGSSLALEEEGILEDWAITVTNAEITDSIKENDYYGFSPEEGNKYLSVSITITNNGKNASTFLPSFSTGSSTHAKIFYQGDYEFSATNLLGYSQELHDTTVNPLSTKSGVIAFEIPDSVASSDDELLLVIYAGKKNLQFKVR